MYRTIKRTIDNRAAAKAEGADGPRWIRTWMHVFRTQAEARVPTTEKRLAELVAQGKYCCVGKSHSYNGVQVVPDVTAMMMREGGLKRCDYDPATKTVHVAASVSLKELKVCLRDHHDRGLLNSGNYMEQTVIGALATGTHGFGPRGVMADGIVSLTFLDGNGHRVKLARGDPDFAFVALSFGTIAPIVEVELETVPLKPFISTSHVTRLSKVAELQKGTPTSNWAVLPYTDPDDPVTMLHTLAPVNGEERVPNTRTKLFTGGWFARFFLLHYAKFDRYFPASRRVLQRFIDWMDLEQVEQIQTDPGDLDYLYDPKPGLAKERAPSITRGIFSTTFTGYNLAFFVPLEKAQAVVKFILHEAQDLSDLGFYLKGVVSVRELPGTSDLIFAANHRRPMAAIDLFADPRDYAWLERLQRQVMHHEPAVRPHFGKSALGSGFRGALGVAELDELVAIRHRYYPNGRLVCNEQVCSLLDPSMSVSEGSAREAGLIE